jgi:tRNA(Ile)-lysidine synthase
VHREACPEVACVNFEPTLLASAIDALLGELRPPASGLCVAYSGGLDSTVLLHGLHGLYGGASLPPLRAVHVDHGLHGESQRWARDCERASAALGLACRVLRVDARAPRGASPEAAARTARYAALAGELAADEVLLTAHHADDQLETVLLQLLRGGGLAGVAGMPRLARFAAGWHGRPLLGFTRAALRVWASAEQLDWTEDPSNLDPRFDRNYLRLAVLPAIRDRWPGAAATVGQVAVRAAEAVDLATSIAAADLAAVREGRTLPLARFEQLSEPRQRAVLRAWLEECGLPLPSARTLAALRRDLWQAAADRIPCARWQDARVYRYRGRLYADRARDPPAAVAQWPIGQGLTLGADGRLELAVSVGRGLSRARLPDRLQLRPREGGETFLPAGHTQHRPLRKWLQERGVLPWLRDRVPLVYAGEELVAVGGVAYGAQYAAQADEPSWEIAWTGRPLLTEDEARSAPHT